MDETNRLAFCHAIAALASCFRVEADTALYEGYWLGLDDLPLPMVQTAVRRAIRQCEHMPRPGQLRELAGVMSPQQRAVLAWDALAKAVSLVGGYKSIDFDDPLINATVIMLGGWERLCEQPAEEFDKWTSKSFARVYITLLETGVSADRASPLLGTHARENGRRAPSPPVKFVTGLPPHERPVVRQVVLTEHGGRLAGLLDVLKGVS